MMLFKIPFFAKAALKYAANTPDAIAARAEAKAEQERLQALADLYKQESVKLEGIIRVSKEEKELKAIKPAGLEACEYVFTDQNGVRYYKFRDHLDMPLKRYSRLQVLITELQNCMTSGELSRFLEAMENAINNTIHPSKPGAPKVTGLSFVGYLVTEMKFRKDHLLHEGIMFQLAATVYIREDEEVSKIDSDIEKQKVEQFRIEADGRLHGFFWESDLKKYMPYSDMSEVQLLKLLSDSMMRIQAQEELLKKYLPSEEQS